MSEASSTNLPPSNPPQNNPSHNKPPHKQQQPKPQAGTPKPAQTPQDKPVNDKPVKDKPVKDKPAKDGGKYSASLNLPKTEFAMRANLVQNEPASLDRWTTADVYNKVQAARADSVPFVFHDGPPYANGSIHLGHLLNKCLKDMVVRSRVMSGRACAYVPGWDCHGLPIEHKVMQELVESGAAKALEGLDPWARKMKVREACAAYAKKYHALHTGQMRRLLTLADYEHPYLTMQPSFEGATLEVLATLLDRGLVFRALKPVHWSVANETALAEAELEYQDREDVSVYVDFEAADADAVFDAFGLPKNADDEHDDEHDDDGEEDERYEDEGHADAEDGADEDNASDESKPATKRPLPGVRPHARPSFMIWTTTPWTLPANLAIAVNPKFEYALVFVDGNVCVMATDAIERVTQLARSEEVSVLARANGEKLVGLKYRHPFVDLARNEGVMASKPATTSAAAWFPTTYSVVAADYVTLEDGTGLVHTAPGHGVEDYQTGLRVGLAVYCPVRANGTYDQTVPQWLRGKHIWKANGEIVKHLKDSGHLFHDQTFMHAYPHDWRSKTPVIFRATDQWFVGVDRPFTVDEDASRARTLRERALAWTSEAGVSSMYGSSVRVASTNSQTDARQNEPSHSATAPTDRVNFVPEWGRNRMRGMLESRPDWCISRQRAWGLPIPAFEDAQGRVFMTGDSVRAVATIVRTKLDAAGDTLGSDAWFKLTAAELLAQYDPSRDLQTAPGTELAWVREEFAKKPAAFLSGLKKGGDILDVWFESGSSWNAVMRERNLGYPIDLYLEGSDQHRGWFQLSLLPALGVTGRPPFKALLTHGFINDKDGKKLSKSRPDAKDYEVDNLLAKYGADVLRWWVSSLAYENDVKVDSSFFDVAGDSYRKIRNTLRFVLSNLSDYTPSDHAPGANSHTFAPTSLEAWVLSKLDATTAQVIAAYAAYDFKGANQALYDFCNETLSAEYLAAVKDRLYCDKADAPRRRQTQAALYEIAKALCKLVAPIMPHTADEAWLSLHAPKEAGTTADSGMAGSTSAGTTCVHLEQFPVPTGVHADPRWTEVFASKGLAKIVLELAKAEKGVENPLDAGLVLPDSAGSLAHFNVVDLADLMSVSEVVLDTTIAKGGEVRVVDLRERPRCERSRKRDGTVKVRSDGGMLSDRDAAAVGVA